MTNTRKLAYIAILSAVSFLLLYFSFPLIPAADFLKVDFSILPVLIALVIFDFKSAIGVLLLRSLLKLLLNNGGPGSMIGLPMKLFLEEKSNKQELYSWFCFRNCFAYSCYGYS